MTTVYQHYVCTNVKKGSSPNVPLQATHNSSLCKNAFCCPRGHLLPAAWGHLQSTAKPQGTQMLSGPSSSKPKYAASAPHKKNVIGCAFALHISADYYNSTSWVWSYCSNLKVQTVQELRVRKGGKNHCIDAKTEAEEAITAGLEFHPAADRTKDDPVTVKHDSLGHWHQ